MLNCDHCVPCAEGRGGCIATAWTIYLGASTFADRAVVSRRSVVKVTPDLPLGTAVRLRGADSRGRSRGHGQDFRRETRSR
jgi:D-arabinose 1-dehydrogenase-like Zn-dependent alcohol dehydrogenase